MNERSPIVVGLDIGGTKTHILRSDDATVIRYPTSNFNSPYDVIDTCIDGLEQKPTSICVGIAAVRNTLNGSVRLIKRDWPMFFPEEASDYYGVHISTANDMITTAAGTFEQDPLEIELKSGVDAPGSPKLVYAWSTGIGAATALPTNSRDGYIYLPSAVGHAGFAPQYEDEADYLKFISSRHLGKLSIEFAIGGDVGMKNLLDYQLACGTKKSIALHEAVSKDISTPIGQKLLDLANSDDENQEAAASTLRFLGGLFGYTLRNHVLTTEVSRIKLTGSVATSLLPYLVQNTDLIERFIDKDARCAYIPAYVGIDLITNPHVAVEGALLLAKKSSR